MTRREGLSGRSTQDQAPHVGIFIPCWAGFSDESTTDIIKMDMHRKHSSRKEWSRQLLMHWADITSHTPLYCSLCFSPRPRLKLDRDYCSKVSLAGENQPAVASAPASQSQRLSNY